MLWFFWVNTRKWQIFNSLFFDISNWTENVWQHRSVESFWCLHVSAVSIFFGHFELRCIYLYSCSYMGWNGVRKYGIWEQYTLQIRKISQERTWKCFKFRVLIWIWVVWVVWIHLHRLISYFKSKLIPPWVWVKVWRWVPGHCIFSTGWHQD